MSRFVLQLQCPKHVDEDLVEIHVGHDGKLPRAVVPGNPNFHELGDAGWGSALHESLDRADFRTFLQQEVVGPSFRGEPGTSWGDNWLNPIPAGYVWDSERGAAYPTEMAVGDRHVDPDGSGAHVRYEARCGRPSCKYTAWMTRTKLLKVVDILDGRRSTMAAEIAFLQNGGQCLSWVVGPHAWAKDTSTSPGHLQPWPAALMLRADWDTLLRVCLDDADDSA